MNIKIPKELSQREHKTLYAISVFIILFAGVNYGDQLLGSNVIGKLSVYPLIFIGTFMVVGGFTSIFYVFTKKWALSAAITSSIIVILSATSYMKYLARFEALLPSDFLIARTFSPAFILGYIDIKIFIFSVIMIVLFTILGVAAESMMKKYKKGSKKPLKRSILERLAALAVGVFCISGSFVIVQNNMTGISANFFFARLTEQRFGILLSFVREIGRGKYHADYTDEEIKAVESEYHLIAEAGNADRLAPSDVNVVYVLMEGFFDPRILSEYILDISQYDFDYSGFERLYEKYPHGTMISSVFGGNTADIEFEALTGMTNFLLNSSAYTDFIVGLNKTDSVVSFLDGYGYHTAAVHPNRGLFYRRDKVYNVMGFDYFADQSAFMDLAEENFLVTDYVSIGDLPGLTKDITVLNEVFNMMEQTEGTDFIHTLTIQNHSPYEDESDYLNRLAMSLSAIKETEKKLLALDEKTVFVIYGDHQSAINFKHIPVSDNDYKTPIIIMSNFDLPNTDIGVISANQISNTLFNLMNWKKPDLYYLLDELQAALPVLTKHHIKYNNIDTTPYADLLRKYDVLEYAALIDE
jgi:phosphoglycerol transferase MdoB-like AlkP superfamily enzyme